MLVVCPDCQKRISSLARTCPDCGRPGPFEGAAPVEPVVTAASTVGAAVTNLATAFKKNQTELPQEPKGLGGWLILVGIGLVVNLLQYFAAFVVIGKEPASSISPFFVILLILATVLSLCAVLLFFYKSRHFPQAFIGLIVVGFFVTAATKAQFPGLEIARDLIVQVLAALIWIPYILKSRRVKNTFITLEGATPVEPVVAATFMAVAAEEAEAESASEDVQERQAEAEQTSQVREEAATPRLGLALLFTFGGILLLVAVVGAVMSFEQYDTQPIVSPPMTSQPVAQMNEQDYADLPIPELTRKAKAGDAIAQFYLGVAYLDGEGVPQVDKEAIYWFRKAAEQGHVAAQTILGAMYREGQGVPKNDQIAYKWFLEAAMQGERIAQFELGVMYQNGWGVPQDSWQAINWYRKAAEQGFAEAQYNLGLMYWVGVGVPRDVVLAYVLFDLAAKNIMSYSGNALSTEDPRSAKNLRNGIAERMTSEQIAEGQDISSHWKAGQPFLRRNSTMRK